MTNFHVTFTSLLNNTPMESKGYKRFATTEAETKETRLKSRKNNKTK
jgi:hypothetical protein